MDQTTLPAPQGDQIDKSADFLGAGRTSTYEGDGPLAWNGPVSLTSFGNLLGRDLKDFAFVTPGEALRQTAVLACLDVMAQDIASAPFTLNRVLTQGRRRRGYEVVAPRAHPLAKLFWLRPNRFMTWWEFTTMIVYHLGLVNNAYVIPVRNRRLEVTELIPVMPGRVQMDIVADGAMRGEVFYRVQASNAAEAAQYGSDGEMIFFADQIIHIRSRFMNGFSGMPTLAAGSRVLSLTDAVTRFQDRVFRRDGTLRGVFEQPKDAPELSQAQYDRLKASLGESLSLMRDLGFPLVLEGGMAFKAISMTAAEAGAKEAFAQQIAETARLFRIPPHKLMHFEGIKYDNLEGANRMYVTDSLEPRCLPIESQFTVSLLSDDEQMDLYVEIDRKALNKSDPKSLSERITKQWDSGLIMLDEAREELGYNPAKDGSVYKMAANTFLIDADHEVVVTNQPSPGTPAGDNAGGNTDNVPVTEE